MSTGRQHHLPAALTGQFGVPRGTKRFRDRVVAVASRKHPGIVERRARSLGVAHDAPQLYDFQSARQAGHSVDWQWQHAEQRVPNLARCLRRKDGVIELDLFVRTLVPLVASLFVRHPSYRERYERRVASGLGAQRGQLIVSDDEVNIGRTVEYLLLCGKLLAAEWWAASSATPLVNSDLGIAGAGVSGGEQLGYLIPVSPKTVVMAVNGRPSYDPGKREIKVRTAEMSVDDAHATNLTIAAWAPNIVFGPSEPVVQRAVDFWKDEPDPVPPSKMIPINLMQESDYGVEDAKRFLRALHDAQQLLEPRTRLMPGFDECIGCAARVEWFENAMSGTRFARTTWEDGADPRLAPRQVWTRPDMQ